MGTKAIHEYIELIRYRVIPLLDELAATKQTLAEVGKVIQLADELSRIALEARLTSCTGPWARKVQAAAHQYRKARGWEE